MACGLPAASFARIKFDDRFNPNGLQVGVFADRLFHALWFRHGREIPAMAPALP
jgi:hypothetical protein